MNYLLLGKSGNAKSLDWLRYFDVVVVGCGKPAYFQGRGQLFSVDVQTGGRGWPTCLLPGAGAAVQCRCADRWEGVANLPTSRGRGVDVQTGRLAKDYLTFPGLLGICVTRVSLC